MFLSYQNPIDITTRKIKKVLFVIALGFILTAVLTYPFIFKLSSYFDESGDYVLCSWILKYNFEAIKSGRIFSQAAYFNANQFYPAGNSLAFSESIFVPGLLFSIILFLTNHFVFSVNFFIFLSFVLSFTSAFYCINKIVRNFAGSCIGAIIFAFNPLTFVHFPGHVQLMQKYFLPFVFLFAVYYFSKPTLKHAFLFFLFFTLNALSSIYFELFSLILVFIILAVYFVYNLIRKNKNYFLALLKSTFIAIPFLFILFYFNYPYVKFSQTSGIKRTLTENNANSGRIKSWLAPYNKSLIYSKLASANQSSESVLFLGVIPTILCIYGLIKIHRKDTKQHLLFFISTFLVLVTTATFTFGPVVHQNIYLPYYLVYKFFPLFEAVRAPSRFQFIFYVPFAIFAAYGTKYLVKRVGKRKNLIFFGIITLLLLENLNRLNFNDQKPMFLTVTNYQKEKTKIISLLKNKITLHLPVKPSGREDSEAQYLVWPILTNEKIMNGYSGFRPKQTDDLLDNVNRQITESKLKEFKKINLNYIILHKQLFKTTLPTVNLPVVFQDSNIIILKLK